MSDDLPGDGSGGSSEGDPRRSGIDVARAALAGARAEARRRGLLPGRPLAPTSGADTTETRAQRERRWARRAPELRSGAHPDDRDPQLLGPTLERLVTERGWDTDVAVGGVMGRWASIVGPEVAAHAKPVAFQDGALLVATDSTAWATQIRLLTSTLLARLANELGAGVVTSVTVRGPSAPSWKKGLFTVRGRGPRDTYG